MDNWINGVRSYVTSWLESNDQYDSVMDVLAQNNPNDVASILAFYQKSIWG